MRISDRQLKKLIHEERISSKMYRRYGLKTVSRDESRHARILRRLLKRR